MGSEICVTQASTQDGLILKHAQHLMFFGAYKKTCIYDSCVLRQMLE